MTDSSSATQRCFSLRHLQEHLPWTIPYSREFQESTRLNGMRPVGHDVLHVMKSLGRIAAEVEGADHDRPRKLTGDLLAKEAADLVLCALHIARLEGFDLQDAVVNSSEARNNASIPPEVAVSENRESPVLGECEECGQQVITPLTRFPSDRIYTKEDVEAMCALAIDGFKRSQKFIAAELVEKIQYIGVKAGVESTILGAMCLEVRVMVEHRYDGGWP